MKMSKDKYFDSKNIFISGEINFETVQHVVSELELFKEDERITVIVGSEGGESRAGMALYDILRRHKNTVAIGAGAVYSAALLAFLGCRERYSLQRCRFMEHESEFPEHYQVSDEEADDNNIFNKEVYWKVLKSHFNDEGIEFLKKGRRMSEAKHIFPTFSRHKRTVKKFFSAEQALKFGVIKKII
jgi:ATP-dependent protease ClpP protease subunit